MSQIDPDGMLWCVEESEEPGYCYGPSFGLQIGIRADGSPTYYVTDEIGDVDREVTPDVFRNLLALKQSAEIRGLRTVLQEVLRDDDSAPLHRIADIAEGR